MERRPVISMNATMTRPYKLLLDNSAVKVIHLQKLLQAKLDRLLESGQVDLLVPPILLHERFDFLISVVQHSTILQVANLFLNLKWKGILREINGPQGIMRLELEGDPIGSILYDDEFSSKLKEHLKTAMIDPSHLEVSDRKILEDYKRFRCELKDGNLGELEDINQQFKAMTAGQEIIMDEPPFPFMYKYMDREIQRHLPNICSQKSVEDLYRYWKNNKNTCPYFNKYIEGFLFVRWYAMKVPGKRHLDKNWLEDLEYLIYLIEADGMVAEEKGFMKEACEALFPNKDFMNVDECTQRLVEIQ